MKVEILKSSIGDNYFYLVSSSDGKAALIDPVDAKRAIAAVSDAGVELVYVVNTHFHHDHVAGDDEVLAAFPGATLVAGDGDTTLIENQVDARVARRLSAGDVLEVGDDLSFDILETPGHTPGHISLLAGDWLFCGDTIFAGGAGNCRFGGDPGVLYATYRDVLAELPDELKFGPGHDYSERNIAFALSLLPGAVGEEMLSRSRASEGLFVTTLGEERRYNPFFLYDDAALQSALKDKHGDVWAAERSRSADDAEATFRTVRELRNHW